MGDSGRLSRNAALWALLGLAGALWLVGRLHAVFTPLLLAWFLAYALDPLLDRLEAQGIKRLVGVLLLLVTVAISLTVVILLVLPALIEQLRALGAALPGYVSAAQRLWIPRVEEYLGRPLPAETSDLFRQAAAALQDRLPGLAPQAAAVLGSAFASAWNLVSAILGLALIPVFSVYLLLEFNGLGTRLLEFVPPRWRGMASRILERSDTVLGAFVRGQLTVCGALALVYAVGLTFTGIDMPWVVGLLSGALFIVPYLGTVVGVAVGSLLALLKYHDLVHLLAVWAVFVVGQLLEGFVLTPRIVGERVGLHPLAVMVAVLAGGELFGFLGILLAVPAAAVLRVGLSEALGAYRNSALFREDAT